MAVARLSGRRPGVPRAPGSPSLLSRIDFCWSGGVREGLDALPGGGDGRGPGPGGGDFQDPAASSAHKPAGSVEDAVTQGFGSAFASLPSRARSCSQASRIEAVMDASSQALLTW
jgi:hypothetical protein